MYYYVTKVRQSKMLWTEQEVGATFDPYDYRIRLYNVWLLDTDILKLNQPSLSLWKRNLYLWYGLALSIGQNKFQFVSHFSVYGGGGSLTVVITAHWLVLLNKYSCLLNFDFYGALSADDDFLGGLPPPGPSCNPRQSIPLHSSHVQTPDLPPGWSEFANILYTTLFAD